MLNLDIRDASEEIFHMEEIIPLLVPYITEGMPSWMSLDDILNKAGEGIRYDKVEAILSLYDCSWQSTTSLTLVDYLDTYVMGVIVYLQRFVMCKKQPSLDYDGITDYFEMASESGTDPLFLFFTNFQEAIRKAVLDRRYDNDDVAVGADSFMDDLVLCLSISSTVLSCVKDHLGESVWNSVVELYLTKFD